MRFRLADDYVDPISGEWTTRLDKQEQRLLPVWHGDILTGEFYCLRADPVDFFMVVRCELAVSEPKGRPGPVEIQYWPPFDDEVLLLDQAHSVVNQVAKPHPENFGIRYDYENMPSDWRHWRLCADKQSCMWRVRDERTGELWEVLDYRGLIRASRFKIGESHLYHDGGVAVGEDGVLHFR